MEKNRLELFSDGVFVIVLTLLVLDLKLPSADGLAGLAAIAPSLAVHAITFLIIGLTWLGHHNIFATVHRISTRTLVLNLLALFWISLIPFGSRIAAEHPLGSLGIGLITACRSFYGFSLVAMTSTSTSRYDIDPKLMKIVEARRRRGLVFSVINLVAAPLCAVSAWIGYATILTVLVNVTYRVFEVRPPAEPSAPAPPTSQS